MCRHAHSLFKTELIRNVTTSSQSHDIKSLARGTPFVCLNIVSNSNESRVASNRCRIAVVAKVANGNSIVKSLLCALVNKATSNSVQGFDRRCRYTVPLRLLRSCCMYYYALVQLNCGTRMLATGCGPSVADLAMVQWRRSVVKSGGQG